MVTLTVRRGPDAGRVYELHEDVIQIGRGSKNNIVLDDNDVSRNHCRLVRQADDYSILDLDSTNGTFINGQRVNSNRVLHNGNLIELGDTITLEYALGPASLVAEQSVSEAAYVTSFAPDEDPNYALVVEIGPSPRRIYAMTADTITIGRDLSSDIVVQDPEVSRWHLQLERTPDGYSAKDLNSTNGTILNSTRLDEAKSLKVFDTLELGTAVRLHYIYDTEEAHQRIAADAAADDRTVQDPTEVGKRETKELKIQFAQKRKTTKLGTGLPQGGLIDHVFVAYHREDWEDVVAPLMVALQDAGMEIWVDQYLVQGSDDWQVALEQALHECWLMVIIVSPKVLESRYVRQAYRYFINREKPVIPVAYKPVDGLPPELSNLETTPYDHDDTKRSFQRLIHDILDRRG